MGTQITVDHAEVAAGVTSDEDDRLVCELFGRLNPTGPVCLALRSQLFIKHEGDDLALELMEIDRLTVDPRFG